MNYFIGDLHFGHKNVLAFDNRPFTSIEKHDECLAQRWNTAVNIDDDVYILGDVSWRNTTETIQIMGHLNGRKHLIVGNHDKRLLKSKNMRDQFVEIEQYKELQPTENEEMIVLSHYPIPCFNRHYYGAYHLYGHVHTGFEWNMMENLRRQMEELYDVPCNMFNVGAMIPYMDYTPRTLEDIEKGYNARRL